MALGTPTQKATGTGSASVTTSSFTPTANALLVTFASAWHTSTLPTDPNISDTASLTWTQINFVSVDPGGTADCIHLRGWWAVAPSSPSSMTVTSQSATSSVMLIQVTEITGASTDLTNNKSGTSVEGDPSCTLDSTPVACVIAASEYAGANDAVGPTGYTSLTALQSSQSRLEVGYDNTSPSATVSTTSTNIAAAIIAVEIKEDAPPTPKSLVIPPPSVISHMLMR